LTPFLEYAVEQYLWSVERKSLNLYQKTILFVLDLLEMKWDGKRICSGTK
jgi:hypothetical protein